MKSEIRTKIVSSCRETAKSLDMSKRGSRWISEVTEVHLKDKVVEYGFYVIDKRTGNEYEVEAIVEEKGNADWNVKFVK